ncbi:hypothetical protein EDB87DRAFT_1605101 [Lactarius vividus]|nr:hypothetical protein EDB87DRAFT_1605101 [Lactarius vividus]
MSSSTLLRLIVLFDPHSADTPGNRICFLGNIPLPLLRKGFVHALGTHTIRHLNFPRKYRNQDKVCVLHADNTSEA